MSWKNSSVILNIVLGSIFVIGLTVLVFSYLHDASIELNYEGLLASTLSLIMFGIKLYYDNKKTGSDRHADSYTSHPFFSFVKEFFLNDIHTFRLVSEGRTLVFKIIIKEQVNSFSDAVKNFLTIKFNSVSDFREQARVLVLNAIRESEDKCRQQQIPETIINKFSSIQTDRIKLLLADIDTMSYYRLKDTQDFNEAMFYFLQELSTFLRYSLTYDTLKTLQSLNGDLALLNYNGLPL